jgi:hypothetical protein
LKWKRGSRRDREEEMKQRLNICENRKIDIVREKNRQLEKRIYKKTGIKVNYEN